MIKNSLSPKGEVYAHHTNNVTKGSFLKYNVWILSKSMSEEQEPFLEIEVLKWDAHSFTIE